MSIPDGWRLVRRKKRLAFARFEGGEIQERVGDFETPEDARDYTAAAEHKLEQQCAALTDYIIVEKRVIRFTEVV